jgi:hypothetical protein
VILLWHTGFMFMCIVYSTYSSEKGIGKFQCSPRGIII